MHGDPGAVSISMQLSLRAALLSVNVWLVAAPGAINPHAMPLGFEPNVGQTDTRVRFFARTNALTFFLTDSEAVLSISGRNGSGAAIRLRLDGANRNPRLRPANPTSGSANYFIAKQRLTNIPRFGAVRYESVYPGIDVVYHALGQDIEYDFVLAANADPSAIKLVFAGANGLSIDAAGDLLIRSAAGTIRQHRARVFQEFKGSRRLIDCRYELAGNGEVRFRLAGYDRSRALVIDPIVTYTFFGGLADNDGAGAIALDPVGNIYVAGETAALNFPTTAGVYQPSPNKLTGTVCENPPTRFCSDAFVMKLNPAGDQVIYSTYFGGSSFDSAAGIAVDSAGDAIVTGSTQSSDFPVTAAAAQIAFGGGQCPVPGFGEIPQPLPCSDVFVTKFDPTGSRLIYSTYLGGSGTDSASAIAIDVAGDTYVTGSTNSTNYPVTPGAYQRGSNGIFQAFVTKLDTAGNLVYSTYLGGSGNFIGAAIAADAAGDAYVAGSLIWKLNPQGSQLIYVEELGNPENASANSIALDASGHAFVAGATNSADFPFTRTFPASAAGQAFSGAYVAELDAAGDPLYAVGLATGYALSMAVDVSGAIYVTGQTNSSTFPITGGAIDNCNLPTGSPYLVKLTAGGATIKYATFLTSTPSAIALDVSGNLWMAGGLFTSQGPATQAVTSIASSPAAGAFVAKLDFSAPFSFGVTCVANAASFLQGPGGSVAPGEIISIFGAGLGPQQGVGAQFDSQGRVASQVGGTTVLIGGIPAPILYAQAGQVNAVVPYEIASGASTTLQVGFAGAQTQPLSLAVVPSFPGIFTLTGTGAGQGAILNQDGSINSASNPAAKGSIIAMFATGDGLESPSQPDGGLTAAPYSETNAPVEVLLGASETQAHVVYAGGAPTLVAGAMQVNAVIPAGLSDSGVIPLTLYVDGVASPAISVAIK